MKREYVALGLMAGAAIGFALTHSPSPEFRWRSAGFDLSLDPKLGTLLVLPESDVHGRPLRMESSRVLVVYAGTCSGCSVQAVDTEKLPTTRYEQIVLIHRGTDTEVRQLRRETPPSVRTVSDPSGSFVRALNAQWAGRWYEYRAGRLARLQRNLEDPP